jgi:hypothetical protein
MSSKEAAAMGRRLVLGLSVVLLGAVAPAGAQGVDTAEAGSREAIAAATTEPRFVSPWVASIPASATVPSPTKFLGHIIGAPGELTRTTRIYGYYRALAAATPRVKVETIGQTEEGREILLVIVGDEDSLKSLDKAREDMAALADPRRTDAAALEPILARAKPFYMFHGGLHSTETGSPEMLMELAYRLAVSEEPLIRQIRANVTVLINPVAEPDGRDREVDWFYRYLKGKTDYEHLPPTSAPYWGKYVFHDNNRDGLQRRLALTRATQDAFLRWHPVAVHDLHESIPLLSIWTGTGPYNPNMDPITATEWHAIAFHEVTAMTGFGMPGVWTWGFTEGWAQFYADSVAINHNAIGRGYETFGNATAETVERVLDPESDRYTGKPVTDPDWYRVMPPPRRFRWSLRNNVNYMETGVLAALQYTSLHGKEMMRHFWQRGSNAVRKGETGKPYAIAIPEAQADRHRLAALLNLVRAHGVEVLRARDAFTVKEGSYPAGTYLVRMDQPYRSYALDLLIAQKFPAESAPYDPYDDVGWALPFSFGVEVKTIDDQAVRRVPTLPVTEAVAYRGAVAGSGPVFLVKDTGQEGFLAARVGLARFRVEAAEKPFTVDDVLYPAGSWVIPAQAGVESALASAASAWGFDVASAAAAPDVPRHLLDLPRLAVLQAWRDTQAAGWLRMTFDDEKIPYTLIMDEDVRRGGLRERFDVIVYPETRSGLKEIVTGIDTRFSPLAYTKTAEFPTHGIPTSSTDITGGFTWRGIGEIETFVRRGGVLITLGNASTLPLDGGIARDVQRARTKSLYTPGSELRVRIRRPEHPITYGYPEITSVFRENWPVYRVRRADRGRVVMQWGTKPAKDEEPQEADDDGDEASAAPEGKKKDDVPALVVSGGVRAGEELQGAPALLDIPTGEGRVVAFGFDPIHRGLTLSDFRFLWNAILNWNDLPPVPETRN